MRVGDWYARFPQLAVQDIASELILFLDVLSPSNSIPVDRVTRIAEMLLKTPEIAPVTIPELKIFLRDAFNFKYGQLYGGFGWNDLAIWFRAFLDERKLARKGAKQQALPEPKWEPPTPEQRLATLFELVDNLNDVPIVYPYLEVFPLIHAKDPDGFRHWFVENAHVIRARALGHSVKESLLARTIGQEQDAQRLRSDSVIDNLIKTEYVRHYCREYLNSKSNENPKQ